MIAPPGWPPRLPSLDPEEIHRYSRHLLLPELGLEGQRRIKGTRVLLVGAGGLGSPAALYLAAAGIGHLTLVDFDAVDVTNLQRQVLHGTRDVGRLKVESARDRLRDLNPHVSLEVVADRLDAGNALGLVSDACVLAGKPNVHASIFRFEGQATVLSTPDAPCYRCIYPSPPAPGEVPSCSEAGVLGVLPGLLGTIQATEALKLAAGIGEPLSGRLLLVDALSMRFRTMQVRRDPSCPACGTREIQELREESGACAVEPREAVPEVSPAELALRLRDGEPLQLLDVREVHEWEVARIPGARHAPLSRLEGAVAGLDPALDTVLYCRSGVRSQEAGRRLRAAGFPRVLSLAGGILRYAAEVDPTLPRY